MGGEELVEVVDREDEAVGRAPLRACLREGLLHRAVAVLVVRPDGTLLLQRRSVRDLWHPGRWTLSCTGHVKAGETYLQAAKRELGEELGISARVTPVAKLLLPRIRSRGLIEWEHVSLFVSSSGAEPTPDPVELEEVRPLKADEVKKMMRGRRLTPDAKILLASYFGPNRGPLSSRPPRRGRRPLSRAKR